MIRCHPEFLEKLDGYRRNQPDLPSRSEAIRRLVQAGLDAVERASSQGAEPPAKPVRREISTTLADQACVAGSAFGTERDIVDSGAGGRARSWPSYGWKARLRRWT